MANRIAPCGWTPIIPTANGSCCPDINDPTHAALAAQAEAVATNLIWRLTGMQYGACDISVRPCKPKTCDPITLAQLIYWDARTLASGAGNLGVFNFFPTLISGQVYNIACGCPTGCCKCRSDCEFLLPGPVASVTTVTVDGVVLNPSAWRVYDDGTLSFDSAVCPPCQNYNVDTGQVGSWSVDYKVGWNVPQELNVAAGMYALEWYKALINDKSCGLPARVTQVARQGVTATFDNPITLLEAGLTGLPMVDQIIRAINPAGLKQPVRVWAPGLYPVRTQTQ